MPTQHTAERRTTEPPATEQEAITFRGATLEEAVAVAEQALGPRIRVVAANRIRRGGIGGFFASDLGVEVSVVLEDETIEEAIERLVAESDEQERSHWLDRRDPPIDPVDPVDPDFAMLSRPPFVGVAEPASATAAPEPRRARLSSPRQLQTVDAGTESAPVLPPRPAALLDPVSAAVMPHIGRPHVVEPVPAELPVRPSVIEPAVIEPAVTEPPVARPLVAEVVRLRPTPPPSRRQVELAVAAADQLIERLSLTPRVKRLSVKVIVRAGDRREVETEATWEALS